MGAGGQGASADDPKSKKIISFAHAFKKHPGFGTVTFYDKDSQKAADAALKWNCAWHNDLKWHLKYCKPDVVCITTPDDTHYEVLKQVADYPPKLVICEKPLCTDFMQGREIVELYEEKNIPILVNYTRRFLPYYKILKDRYDSGELGKLLFVYLIFNRGWEHTASHAFDFLNWLTGNEKHIFMEANYVKADYRIWQLNLFFEHDHWREERIGDMPVWGYYDFSHWYVVDNAYAFLNGAADLKCTANDAQKAIEQIHGYF